MHHNILSAPGFSGSYQLYYSYKTTLSQVLEVFEAQSRSCAICGSTHSGAMSWNIDHARLCCSGKRSCGGCVRAILCHLCNKGLGLFQDDSDLLLAGAAYLRKWAERITVA
jgi:Recombination endonuclease VII